MADNTQQHAKLLRQCRPVVGLPAILFGAEVSSLLTLRAGWARLALRQ
ncbi:MAG: hypothetical protein JOY71_30095 [Acetobacteraceae bacterium]|nr:hypothetical protein [Acetobacteraceae bacterium]MBV8526314.1 hypothetical protein [Acetobacteraceae bacterium]